MAILRDQDRAAVEAELAKLAGPVKLVVFGSELGAETSAETRRLMQEVAECSERVSVEALNLHLDRERAEAYGVDREPAIVVEGARDYGIRFFGLPLGYEFRSLLDAMQVAASGEPQLAATTLEQLQVLRDPIHIRVFTTPT